MNIMDDVGIEPTTNAKLQRQATIALIVQIGDDGIEPSPSGL